MIYVLFIPGLGDHKTYGQHIGLKLWRIFGVRTEYYALHWADGEAFEPKYERLQRHIEELATEHGKIALVGTSAAATAVLSAYAENPSHVFGAVTICGKIGNLEGIRKEYFQENPAFYGAVMHLKKTLPLLKKLQRRSVLTLRPTFDPVVSIDDQVLEGAHNICIGGSGHGRTIARSILFKGWLISRFLKGLSEGASRTPGV